MDDTVLVIVGFVLGLVVLDVLALRYGHDSRSRTPERPLLGEPAARLPSASGRRARALQIPILLPGRGSRIGGQVLRRPFQLYVPRDVLCYKRYNPAATGKYEPSLVLKENSAHGGAALRSSSS